MIAYVDSSLLVRAYLDDEEGQATARAVLDDADIACVTGSWTRIEVTGALVRASRAGRGDIEDVLTLLGDDLGVAGRVSVVTAPQDEVETVALRLAREHGIRALDAWHLAVATVVLPELSERGEDMYVATRDEAQAAVAESLGFARL